MARKYCADVDVNVYVQVVSVSSPSPLRPGTAVQLELSGEDSNVTPVMFVPALFVWTWPTLDQLLLLFGVGVFATLNQRFLSRAFAATDATAVLPFDFARLPFAAIIGFLVFAELPEIWVWLGGAVIFGSSVYIAHSEARTVRQRPG